MKTAERVLLTSLEMFNQQGEANVTCVDIALELDISPGNLYYHYKGKEKIIEALFEMYKQRMNQVLLSPHQDDLTIEDFFYFLMLILQISHLFRFLYRNPADLMEKYPSIERKFSHLLQDKEKSVYQLLQRFCEMELVRATDKQIEAMVELTGLMFTQSTNYYLLKGGDVDSEDGVHRSLQGMFFAIAPYISMAPEEIQALYESIGQE